jgi:hypothetical protein
MRRAFLFGLVAMIVLAAGSASAEWNLGMRMVGTGNYFPYLPFMQLMQVAESDQGGMIVADAGLFGYKEFIVGYDTGGVGSFCFEGSFAMDNFGSTFTYEGADVENDLTWWYAGGTVLYNFMTVGDASNAAMTASAGVRFQYGTSELKYVFPSTRDDTEMKLTGSTTQFSVPIRFMWTLANGHIGIGPEVALKYTTGSTEQKQTAAGHSSSADGPEYTGFDTEYSLMMKFMF